MKNWCLLSPLLLNFNKTKLSGSCWRRIEANSDSHKWSHSLAKRCILNAALSTTNLDTGSDFITALATVLQFPEHKDNPIPLSDCDSSYGTGRLYMMTTFTDAHSSSVMTYSIGMGMFLKFRRTIGDCARRGWEWSFSGT